MMSLFEVMGAMDSIEIGLWVSGFMLVMVIIGVRVAFAAAIAGFLGLVWIFSAKLGFERGLLVAIKMAGTIPHSKVSSLALSLIPTFILIGFLAYHAGLTRSLFEAAKRWVGWLPGGMGVATVFSTAGFAAVSGASVATSAVFARIAVPEMLKLGYDKRFAAGVVAAGGTLASLIPPSAILVIYAIIVEQDVGALLMAGFLPGAVSALIYGGLVVFLALTRKNFGPPVRGFTWKERFETSGSDAYIRSSRHNRRMYLWRRRDSYRSWRVRCIIDSGLGYFPRQSLERN
ncbi:TRAP-type C4-dicarboxylate transport system large permease component [Vibrio maritimus]|uniref:TRAP-type C4-dicarboxylate transport system large permease component n=1 Tax=Vibrio maritimus TaxID=990268 RepID=A0A090RVW4_9VIBR|nr:TRAP-type C4-dicarboxylate transport system large permease component [Vibrio maritimus]